MIKNPERIWAFEAGELDEDETVELFQELVDTGLAWKLQGMYGRTAARLIQEGLVSVGEIDGRQWLQGRL